MRTCYLLVSEDSAGQTSRRGREPTFLMFEAAAPEIDDFETALGRVSQENILQQGYARD
jgi:hypothetical protein